MSDAADRISGGSDTFRVKGRDPGSPLKSSPNRLKVSLNSPNLLQAVPVVVAAEA